MLLFDIGANRGDAVVAGLNKGFDKIIALEPAPKMFYMLYNNFKNDKRVIPLKYAVSDSNDEKIEFYECVEDGLSTIEKSWLTGEGAIYNGKQFKTIKAITCTIDYLVEKYGIPDLVKIDVEGAESQVFGGMTCKPKQLCFEWSLFTLDQHLEQLKRLRDVNGYTEFALQYITDHLVEPTVYQSMSMIDSLPKWIEDTKDEWENGGWLEYGLRQTTDVGMIWVK
jgi:FkbM family methyltransferase